MATFYEALSENSRKYWPLMYELFTGKKWDSPTKEGITCETKLEDISEIAKLMREVPNPTRRE